MAEHFGSRIEEYIEGSLVPGERAAFERHVEACARCRRQLDQALEGQQLLDLLAPTEPAPIPGPNFYFRVQDEIDRNLSQSWFSSLSATLGVRWTYPVVLVLLLIAAFALTSPARSGAADDQDGLAAMEYPATDFAQMTFTQVDVDSQLGQDLVIRNLVVTDTDREDGN